MPRSCPAALRYGALALIWLAVSSLAAYAAASAGDTTVQMPVVTPEMHEYSRLHYIAYFVGTAYEIAVHFLILQTGLSVYIRDRAEHDAKNPVMQFTLYLMALYAVMCLSMAPLAYADTYLTEHYFGLSQQSFLSWLLDLIKIGAIGFVLIFPVAGSLFLLVRKMPRGSGRLFFAWWHLL